MEGVKLEKEYVGRFKGHKIKLFLNNGDILNGEIYELSDSSILFKDKFNEIISIDYSIITMIKPVTGEARNAI